MEQNTWKNQCEETCKKSVTVLNTERCSTEELTLCPLDCHFYILFICCDFINEYFNQKKHETNTSK